MLMLMTFAKTKLKQNYQQIIKNELEMMLEDLTHSLHLNITYVSTWSPILYVKHNTDYYTRHFSFVNLKEL
jgi:hypothetical protein